MVAVTSMSSPMVLSFLLLFFLTILFFFFSSPRAIPPESETLPAIPLPEELDDLALFRRAILSSTQDEDRHRRFPVPPSRSPPKIAFLFLTNSDLSFAPLWERFFHGHSNLYNIYIHADPTVPIKPPSGVFRYRFIPSKPTRRASATLISAARRLLAAALLADPSNAFFALLSQHCIPIHSFRFVYRTLFNATANDSPTAAAGSLQRYHHRRRRYRSFIEILAYEPWIWQRYIARGEEVMMPEVAFEQFRVGSQFFILTRRHAVLVVRDRKLWNKFRLPCLKVLEENCYPEEHYFPTLLSMQDPEGCSHYTLTRVNWTGAVGGHPHMYFPEEVSAELVKELRKSNSTYSYLFARKFAALALGPLLKIADTVLFRD